MMNLILRCDKIYVYRINSLLFWEGYDTKSEKRREVRI